MKIFYLITVLAVFFACINNASTFGEVVDGKWTLVWEDNFDNTNIDTSKWSIENADLHKNKELQYYSADEVYIRNGYLFLRSSKKKKDWSSYTSGLVETKGKFAQTYGRFEIKAKLPRGQGMWPAHWLMNASGRWPPEIDIMEMKGDEPNKVYMTNHFGTYPDTKMEGSHYTGPDFSKDFHVFALEWDIKELRWYVDGVKRFSTSNNIPKIPFYLVLNTAVGGDWSGNPDNMTQFPQYHVIDYVRIYKLDIEGYKTLDISSVNGRIVCSPNEPMYKNGSRIKLTAKPDIGYKFVSWTQDITSIENPVDFVINKNYKITAEFVVDTNAPRLLSKGKTVKASSVQMGGFPPENVVDGNSSTRWSSMFSDPQWIYVDLGKICKVKAIELEWELAYGKNYMIQVSDNTRDWKTVEIIADTRGGKKDIWLNNIHARYVRVYGESRASSWGYSLYEFSIYGEE